MQTLDTVAIATLPYLPTPQPVQAPVPEARSLYAPATQPVHVAAPVETNAYVPAEQGAHAVDELAAVVLLNFPTVHAVHTPDENAEATLL